MTRPRSSYSSSADCCPARSPSEAVLFPLLLEPDGLGELHVTELARVQRDPAAAFYRGELLLVARR